MRRMSSLVAALVVLWLPLVASAEPIIDTLGSATPTTQFSIFPSGGPGIASESFVGPQFSLTEATQLTEIGGFIADGSCDAGECTLSAPFTVQIRPSTDGIPDLSRVLASFVLSTDNDPFVVSYETAQIDLTLGAGTYFALFAPALSGGAGYLLVNALSLDGSAYVAGSTPMGFLNPVAGDSLLFEVPAAVRILGEPARAVPAPPGIWLLGSGALGLLLWVKGPRLRRPVLDQYSEVQDV